MTTLLLLGMILTAQLPAGRVQGRVHGRVLDPSGAVLIGAPVVIAAADGRTVETKTNRLGVYVLDHLTPGDYVLTVQAPGSNPGFSPAQQPVTIVAGTDRSLDITLTIAVQHHEIVVDAEPARAATDPASNADATIIKGKDLDALSDDPDELEAQLHALAGGGANGGQIYVDGFTGGKLPPKSAIQEIRINQNPYSAEFDTLGTGRIEIVTKPGSRRWNGRFLLDGNTSAWNSRNPFLTRKPDHHSTYFQGTVGGPLGPAASFTVSGDLQDTRETAAVNATILDGALNQATLNETAPNPRRLILLNPRVDLQPARNHMLSFRYRLNAASENGDGVGQLSLASQAFDVRRTEHDVQVTDLQTLSATLLNDVRFEYRTSDVTQSARSGAPQISALGAFTGGGSNLGNSDTRQQHVELHDSVSVSRGAHMVRAGGRLRLTSTSDSSEQNFNGTFTFDSLDAFQITERGLQLGWTPAEIRAAGGGASQFSVVAGQPAVSDTMVDLGLFAQDDWRVRPNLTISGGLRYETQNDMPVRANLAPRVSMAWSLGGSKKGAAPPWVLRAGFGLFYDRFAQTLALQAEHLDGVRTQQFIVASPDFYPTVPSATTLAAARLTPTLYRIDPALTVPSTAQAGVTAERKVGKTSTVAVGYLYSHGTSQLLSRNINALTGNSPTYQFESEGTFNQHQLTTNFNVRFLSWLECDGSYVLGSAHGNTSGPMSFPSNPEDLAADYGRTMFDVRHRVAMYATIDLPGFRVVPFIMASSGQPFDITVGRDLNGDSIFNDRPAFATDLSRPSVVRTPFGIFDTLPIVGPIAGPIPGQTIIPRNFGTGPAHASVNLRVMKPFVVHDHYTIRFDVVVSNLFNHVNAAQPIGNLSSPRFGQSIASSNTFSPSANRQVHIQMQVLF